MSRSLGHTWDSNMVEQLSPTPTLPHPLSSKNDDLLGVLYYDL